MVISYVITTNSVVHSRPRSIIMDEVGFQIPRVGFRIPRTGFPIPKPRIPDSKGKKMLDSGFRIPLHGAIDQ